MKKLIITIISTAFFINLYSQITDTNDEVGIGTTNPSKKLTVSSAADVYIRVEKPQYSDNLDLGVSSHNGNINYTAGTYENSILRLSTNNAPRIHIGYDGNVGIGTSVPIAKLDVTSNISNGTLGTVFGRMSEGNSLGAGTFLGVRGYETQFNTYGGKSFAIEHSFYGETNSSINFYRGGSTKGGFITFNTSDNSEKVRITTEGDVGIGTTNTFGYKLAVNGTIGANEVKVEISSAWPDYVFSNNYYLKDLNDVESFVNKHEHLPDMPTATEVEENGVNLGEMDAKLLQKIEELTLYMIEINKRVNTLEAENLELKEKLGQTIVP